MKASTLTTLAQQKTGLELEFLSRKSIAWYKDQIQGMKNPTRLAREIAVERDRQGKRFLMGGLYHYYYDPKTKEELPYYDVFPLVIPLQKYPDGFLGLNLHYLPITMRATFMDKLMNFAIMNKDDDPMRLRVTYDILSATNRYKEFRPCIKRYLTSHIVSKIMTVKPHEWETALFLPTHQFKKAPVSRVHKDSRDQIRRTT
jgi:hypothetical protein